MCLSLMDQTLSPDSMWLAMNQAAAISKQVGVPDSVAKDIILKIGEAWKSRRSRHPLHELF